MTFALGAALYHSHSFVDDPAPLERFLVAFHGGAGDLTQFGVPIGPKKGRPAAYRLEKLLARVRTGELYSLRVETPATTPDPAIATAGFDVAPASAVPESARRGHLYRMDAVVGASELARRGAAAVVTPLVELAGAVSASAGAVLTAESASFAHALATGSGGNLTDEQDRRVRDVFYSVHELDGAIRGPEWGTFLSSYHVAVLGGADRVEAAASCARVDRLPGGGIYLQLTDAPPRPDDPSFAEARAQLARLLAPVMKADARQEDGQ